MTCAKEIIAEARSRGLEFAQFKSCENVDAALLGLADFDFIIRPDDHLEWLDLLTRHGYVRRQQSQPWRNAFIDDYIAPGSNGEMFHFSIHRKLILGSAPVKSRVWETPAQFLAESELRWSPGGVPCVPADVEAALGCIRLGLKIRPRAVQLKRPGAGLLGPETGIVRQLADLLGACSDEEMIETLGLLIPPESAAAVLATSRRLVTTEKTLRNQIALAARARFVTRHAKAVGLGRSIWLRFRSSLRPNVRFVSRPGFVVACLGIDGSGKTTLSSSLSKAMSMKLTVRRLYLGKAPRNIFGDGLRACEWTARQLRWRRGEQAFREIAYLRNAAFRYRQYMRARKAAMRGELVICDRFPTHNWLKAGNPMDGPRITSETQRGRLEHLVYRRLNLNPDLILLLVTELATAAGRQLSRSGSVSLGLEEKERQVAQLADSHLPVAVLDADQGPEVVMSKALLVVWTALLSRPPQPFSSTPLA